MNQIQCYILISNVISLKLKNNIPETHMQRKQSNKKEQKLKAGQPHQLIAKGTTKSKKISRRNQMH